VDFEWYVAEPFEKPFRSRISALCDQESPSSTDWITDPRETSSGELGGLDATLDGESRVHLFGPGSFDQKLHAPAGHRTCESERRYGFLGIEPETVCRGCSGSEVSGGGGGMKMPFAVGRSVGCPSNATHNLVPYDYCANEGNGVTCTEAPCRQGCRKYHGTRMNRSTRVGVVELVGAGCHGICHRGGESRRLLICADDRQRWSALVKILGGVKTHDPAGIQTASPCNHGDMVEQEALHGTDVFRMGRC
jgi:hypothetical protein